MTGHRVRPDCGTRPAVEGTDHAPTTTNARNCPVCALGVALDLCTGTLGRPRFGDDCRARRHPFGGRDLLCQWRSLAVRWPEQLDPRRSQGRALPGGWIMSG